MKIKARLNDFEIGTTVRLISPTFKIFPHEKFHDCMPIVWCCYTGYPVTFNGLSVGSNKKYNCNN